MMTMLLWLTAGFLLGILLFIGTPVLLGPQLDLRSRQRIALWYYGLAAAAYRRFVLVKRKHSGYDLRPSSFDAEKEGEKISLDGETEHYTDAKGNMTRFLKRPFGILLEGPNQFVSPSDADVGADAARIQADGNVMKTLETSGGQKVQAVNSTTRIPDDDLRMVSLDAITSIIPDSWTGKDPETIEENVEKSQEGFKSTNPVTVIMLAAAYGFGCVLAWFIYSNTGDGGESVVTVPTQIAQVALGVI